MSMQKRYRFAGLEFQIEMPEDCAYKDEWNLAFFRTDAVQDPHRCWFEYVDELTVPSGNCCLKQPNFEQYLSPTGHVRYLGGVHPYIRAEHNEKEHFVQIKRNAYTNVIGVKTVLESLEIEHLIARNNGFIFHCSYIDHNGKAILFTAPSGTGKSTQAELWKKYRNTDIVNGDRAVIKVNNNSIEACGLPYSGSSEYCENVTLPLTTIIYLSQDNNTSIRKMTGLEAFRRVWEQISVPSWNKDAVDQISMNVLKIIKHIPIYHLCCTPDETAILAVESVLDELEMNNS